MSTKQITLPVTGMTCANCVKTIERTVRKLEGVENASVNYASEKVEVVYDPAVLNEAVIVEKIENAGYGVPVAQMELPITGMTCANCAATVTRALKKVPGVLNAEVNYATERATVRLAAGAVQTSDLVTAVEKAGYGVVLAEAEDELEDAEAAARAAELKHQYQRLLVGVVFTVPLFLISMLRDMDILGMWAHESWVNYLLWALATPVQFYVGWDYYVGAYKALRNKTANMDVL
ncbi:MAG: heavy metal translocating P-type ATPase, partial [Anaerolineae bacterium]|nr:heavy metal translocating P-type ATPase [Anaerolineae bacterium]